MPIVIYYGLVISGIVSDTGISQQQLRKQRSCAACVADIRGATVYSALL